MRGRSEEYNAVKPTVPFYSGRLLNLLEESIKDVNGQNKKTKLQSGGIDGRKEQTSEVFSDITTVWLGEKKKRILGKNELAVCTRITYSSVRLGIDYRGFQQFHFTKKISRIV